MDTITQARQSIQTKLPADLYVRLHAEAARRYLATKKRVTLTDLVIEALEALIPNEEVQR